MWFTLSRGWQCVDPAFALILQGSYWQPVDKAARWSFECYHTATKPVGLSSLTDWLCMQTVMLIWSHKLGCINFLVVFYLALQLQLLTTQAFKGKCTDDWPGLVAVYGKCSGDVASQILTLRSFLIQSGPVLVWPLYCHKWEERTMLKSLPFCLKQRVMYISHPTWPSSLTFPREILTLAVQCWTHLGLLISINCRTHMVVFGVIAHNSKSRQRLLSPNSKAFHHRYHRATITEADWCLWSPKDIAIYLATLHCYTVSSFRGTVTQCCNLSVLRKYHQVMP